jgi:hypothetical protein
MNGCLDEAVRGRPLNRRLGRPSAGSPVAETHANMSKPSRTALEEP